MILENFCDVNFEFRLFAAYFFCQLDDVWMLYQNAIGKRIVPAFYRVVQSRYTTDSTIMNIRLTGDQIEVSFDQFIRILSTLKKYLRVKIKIYLFFLVHQFMFFQNSRVNCRCLHRIDWQLT